ncbi:hypothetical protein FRIGORI9N_470051 [Frigoribacterium sp. 9N]|nr:hypothetical protein FRIGORI9N_470051 [Frigoribacterium sp. 9N]
MAGRDRHDPAAEASRRRAMARLGRRRVLPRLVRGRVAGLRRRGPRALDRSRDPPSAAPGPHRRRRIQGRDRGGPRPAHLRRVPRRVGARLTHI